MLWRLDAMATMPFDRIPFNFLGFKNSFLCRACRCISLCLCCYFIISLFIRRWCLLTGFFFTSWALGILFLYRAGWCISLYLCFLFFFFCVWKALVLMSFACFLVSLTHLNSVDWHYDFPHLHPQAVHWPLLVGGWSLEPCQLADRSKFIDTSPSNS